VPASVTPGASALCLAAAGRDLRERPRGPLVFAAIDLAAQAGSSAIHDGDRNRVASVSAAQGTWERLADLPLRIDSYSLQGLQAQVSSEFERKSTVVHLVGAGEEGLGEDVTYDAVDHDVLQAAGATLPLAGSWTLGSLSDRLASLDLFPQPPQREVSRRYRIWAFESAALDLALRQAGTNLCEALGREPRPVRFVVSLRLGEPPSMEPLRRRLTRYPGLRFKLDPTSSWDEPLIAELAACGAVDSVDFKAYYTGSIVDQPADPVLYRRVVEALPEAWIEDPALTAETDAVLAAHRKRFSWDAPIHSIADVEALRYPPRMVNVKPSRLGGLRNLLEAFDYCAQRGIGNYGGGQFELGVGRGQIQYLASLFHPDAPNDVAPSGYNLPEPPDGLPSSPLAASPSQTGFRWQTNRQ
jgi:L-alanine-DL-glutamate epimerase-like enolase superfamily enzyme